jgi:hypothetical protein
VPAALATFSVFLAAKATVWATAPFSTENKRLATTNEDKTIFFISI